MGRIKNRDETLVSDVSESRVLKSMRVPPTGHMSQTKNDKQVQRDAERDSNIATTTSALKRPILKTSK